MLPEIVKWISYVGSAGAVAGMCWGGGSFVDKHFAHQDDFTIMVIMADEDRSNDAMRQIQARIWRLEDHYGFDHSTWPQAAKEEVRDLEAKKKLMEHHLERLDNQLMQKNRG